MTSLNEPQDNRTTISPARRAALINAVENGQVTINQACEEAGVSLRTFYRWRRGSGPGRSCTPLAQRLACISAVESGEMTMVEACQHYTISTRTYYRWLAQKDQIVALTSTAGGVALPDQVLDQSIVRRQSGTLVGDTKPRNGNYPRERDSNVADLELGQEGFVNSQATSRIVARQGPWEQALKSPRSMERREEKIREEDAMIFDSDSYSNSLSTTTVPWTRYKPRKQSTLSTCQPDSRKHRIIVMNGTDQFSLVWYAGASTGDIKSAVRRHFKLQEEVFFTLRDAHGEEVNISPSLRSGSYHLVL